MVVVHMCGDFMRGSGKEEEEEEESPGANHRGEGAAHSRKWSLPFLEEEEEENEEENVGWVPKIMGKASYVRAAEEASCSSFPRFSPKGAITNLRKMSFANK